MDEKSSLSVKTLTHLPKRKSVNIEFHDLSFSVPDGKRTSKLILRGVCGNFLSGQLTAILGPSGAGKSTLLNVLAGYKHVGAKGNILINGHKRNLEKFRRISRYIMQEDHVQPYITVLESMQIAANLKLGKNTSEEDKHIMIDEILGMLRLIRCRSTLAKELSGGERKRLAIALELLNNPPIIFLDEPTTGLDDVASSQCVGLLKLLAEGGRTVICALHTPSAKLFSVFDNVYIVSQGQCTYQGYGPSVVSFLSSFGLDCPLSYNPADFIMEVCSKEYGDFQNKMVSMNENGRNSTYCKGFEASGEKVSTTSTNEIYEYSDMNETGSSFFEQVLILILRMCLQIYRDKSGLLLKISVTSALAIIIGNLYIGMGNDGSMTLYNFGFFYVCIIFFMYIPMMPVLLWFPTEIKILKREHLNQWYELSSYFTALTIVSLPVQIVMTLLYVAITYPLSGQPLEWERMVMFYIICLITALVAESLGLVIGALFNIVNALFIGTCVKIPLMLLATYGFGSGAENIPNWIRISMYFSYLRYSMEGLMSTMLRNRPVIPCPDDESWCFYTDVGFFLRSMGMENVILWLDLLALLVILIIFKATGYYILKQRLSPNKISRGLNVVFKIVKAYLGP